jgi:hypothetical protein
MMNAVLTMRAQLAEYQALCWFDLMLHNRIEEAISGEQC